MPALRKQPGTVADAWMRGNDVTDSTQPETLDATWRHPYLGEQPVSLAAACWLLARVTQGLSESLDSMVEYDEENPHVWSGCHEHPEGGCGYRDLPTFYTTALMYGGDIRDAKTFLEAWNASRRND